MQNAPYSYTVLGPVCLEPSQTAMNSISTLKKHEDQSFKIHSSNAASFFKKNWGPSFISPFTHQSNYSSITIFTFLTNTMLIVLYTNFYFASDLKKQVSALHSTDKVSSKSVARQNNLNSTVQTFVLNNVHSLIGLLLYSNASSALWDKILHCICAENLNSKISLLTSNTFQVISKPSSVFSCGLVPLPLNLV